ncbi:NADH-quinone oxidoreductase subunit C [Arsenicicoccus piscis]|uniref:NADH-quinone oxidoreductase subunit C n=1 Tax=Arsenicicoccus piscis TaxID=673954 RepID=A0ABQ6HKM7_9MICO|nr:NADH-quinone oxidoreductase subunit C [Arsenicicoccus piscis]MCH8627729.1 NADH-quinone oxidoreductase subunit C [Arsenicicoccus piscis]GMA18239.1 NADH-quinone oxidoreductase subunit C [Arsenicicoccus piscis]
MSDNPPAKDVPPHQDIPTGKDAPSSGDTPVSSGTTAAGDPSDNALEARPVTGDPTVVGTRHGMFGIAGSGDTSGYGGLVSPILFPGQAERPYGSYFDHVADQLEQALVGTSASFQEAVEQTVVHHGELTFHVRREHLPVVAQALRDHPKLRFEQCVSVSGVHYPSETDRELHVVYHLLSLTHAGRRVRLEVSVPDADPHVPSVTATYPGANWHERETWDFFGVVFDDHPALTRIMMPDDWPGHPQRKDYPLGGVPVEYKGASIPPPDERRSYN